MIAFAMLSPAELAAQNDRLACYWARRFDRRMGGQGRSVLADLVQEARLALWQAAVEWRGCESRRPFEAVAGSRIYMALRAFVSKNCGLAVQLLDEPIDPLLDEETEVVERGETGDSVGRLLAAVDRLGKNRAAVIRLRYGLRRNGRSARRLTLTAIAERLQISRKTVHRLHRQGLQILGRVIGYDPRLLEWLG